MAPELKAILEELKREFESLYGDRLVQMVLFGSRARGDAAPDSDIDVLVVLRGPVDWWDEIQRTSEVTAHLCLKHEVLIQRVFASEEDFLDASVGLLRSAHREGVPV